MFEAHLPVEKPRDANLEGVVGQVSLFNRLLSAEDVELLQRKWKMQICVTASQCILQQRSAL